MSLQPVPFHCCPWNGVAVPAGARVNRPVGFAAVIRSGSAMVSVADSEAVVPVAVAWIAPLAASSTFTILMISLCVEMISPSVTCTLTVKVISLPRASIATLGFAAAAPGAARACLSDSKFGAVLNTIVSVLCVPVVVPADVIAVSVTGPSPNKLAIIGSVLTMDHANVVGATPFASWIGVRWSVALSVAAVVRAGVLLFSAGLVATKVFSLKLPLPGAPNGGAPTTGAALTMFGLSTSMLKS